ncbi:hypothetical protein B0J15DRAFT_575124, partial [Fusarium solani]
TESLYFCINRHSTLNNLLEVTTSTTTLPRFQHHKYLRGPRETMDNTTSGIYSDDRMSQWNAIVRSGWPTVISSNSWAIAVALMTLLYQTVVVRLFRPYTMALFWILSEDHREWDIDQLRVAMANMRGPLAALLSTPAYRTLLGRGHKKGRLAKGIVLLWLFGALVLAVIPFFLPILLARGIPIVQGVPGSDDYCSPMLNFSNWTAEAQYGRLLTWDMLRLADIHGYNYSAMNAPSVGLLNDKDRVAISSDCPEWAPVCDRNNSLRIDIDFWIKRSELGIGSGAPSEYAEFGVLNTCYKLEYRRKFLRTEQDGTETYGLLYGTGAGTGGSEYVTDEFNAEERVCYGYDLFAHYNTSRNSNVTIWKPNDTLAHDGDRTILFYHIRNILSPSPSDDAIFGTNSTPIAGSYLYRRAIIPVMCNTSYAYCLGEAGDCVSLGGTEAVSEYIYNNSESGYSRGLGFLELMWVNTWKPLFFLITDTSESIYASRTLSLGSTQLAPREISGHAEIVRLALASRMLLLTSATRAVSGWRKYVSSGLPVRAVDATEEQLETCRLTLMEAPGQITTTAWVIMVVVLIGGILLLFSFAGPLLRCIFWKWLCVYTIRWRLRTAPHLHRMTVERGDPSRFWPGGATDEWPTGRGCVDRVGLVESFTGYHAVYRPDAQLRYMPRQESRAADEIAMRG